MNTTEALTDAIKAGDAARVKDLIEQDPDLVNARDGKGLSPVLLAAYYHRKEVVQAILATGPELNIYEAAAVGQLERVKALAAADASLVNSYSPDGFTPLGLAAFFGHKEIADFLVA